MKHNLELLKADVLDELAKIQRVAQEFAAIEPQLDRLADAPPLYDRAAVGYYLHSFYNGCENIFRAIAGFFENDVGRDAWHRDLLKRMKLSIPGYRPAVIDAELFALLDDFRAFRHIFRHSYTFELDWDKERLVAQKLSHTATLFHAQTMRFLASLAAIEAAATQPE